MIKMPSNLLISEPPLQVLPSLAVKIGLNEAIILQQFHYWLQRSNNIKDGRRWIYNSYTEWNKQFPFWSRNTLRRTLSSLEKQDLIITGNYNKAGFDKTKWYSIDYAKLNSLTDDKWANDVPKMGKRCAQNGQMDKPKMGKPIPIDYQENTTLEDTSLSEASSDRSKKKESPKKIKANKEAKELLNYLNRKRKIIKENSKGFNPKIDSNISNIRSRLLDGFTFDDCKRVIDVKFSKWVWTQYEQYLTPITLFRPKNFERYLNEQPNNRSTLNQGKERILMQEKGVHKDEHGVQRDKHGNIIW